MGSNGSRVLEIDNVEDWLSQCQPISQSSTFCDNSVCPVYGPVEYVSFQNMEFFLGKSQDATVPPHRSSLHYLIRPDYLLFPNFVLLENICPQDYN